MKDFTMLRKKHVSKLFILNNYVKKLCAVQGNLYRVVRHKNMCNALYLIAADTTLIKNNDPACKSKLTSLLWNWFFSISGKNSSAMCILANHKLLFQATNNTWEWLMNDVILRSNIKILIFKVFIFKVTRKCKMSMLRLFRLSLFPPDLVCRM